MATPPSSRGIGYQFDGDQFRNAVRFVFEMGEPPETTRQVTFHFTEVVTFSGRADGDNVPFDPLVPVVRVTQPPIQVPCDVKFTPAGDDATPFGTVIPAKVTVTLLDEDYQLVKDSTFIVVSGDRYLRHFEPPAYGLFDVGIHEIVYIAENER